MTKPELTFFCELPTDQLGQLFDGRFLIDDLRDMGAKLSLGILDLSEERAKVVKRLNKAGLPVTAWLLLPEEQGYWFNIGNVQHAMARYLAFKDWTAQFDLHWAGIGLDIEININEVRQILEEDQGKQVLSTIVSRFFDRQKSGKAQQAYQSLVDLIRADGYLVESYHLPLITEERRGRSSVLQRTLGLVDVATDREVLMLYSSFLRPNGDAILWSYAPDADSIGVGSTGGGVDIKGVIDVTPLSWEEFSRDLRFCSALGKPIHIFSLEGCIQQDFLSKLSHFDWDEPISQPPGTGKIKALRTGLAAVLWIFERPWVILASLLTLIGLGLLFKKKQQS
jgi:hypothetical protein